MAEFNLGDKVCMSGTVRKTHTERTNDFGRLVPCVEFIDSGLPLVGTGSKRRTTADGIVVGQRTVQPGRIEYGDWEDPTEFIADTGKAENVWLVAFDLRRKPVMCRTHQITTRKD